MEGKASDWRPGPTVCRCCLTEGCYKDISTEYFWMGKREVYAEMLSETLNVSIAFSKSGGPNSNSRLICEPCIARLRDASEFKRQVIDCEKTFMHHLDPGSSSRSREFNVETIGEVKVEVVKREKTSLSDDDFDDRPDFLDVDTDDDLDDQPLTKLASKIPKKEVDLLDLLDSSQITVKRKSNLKLKETPPKKIIKKKEVVKASVSKAPPAKQAEKKKELDPVSIARRNAHTIVENSTAYPFRLPESTLMCVFCCKTFPQAVLFRRHMVDEHSNFKLNLAFAHISEGYLKVDITELRCRICKSPFPNLDEIAVHLNKVHSKKIDLDNDLGLQAFRLENDKFVCPICEQKAANLCALSRHIQKHYRKCICEQCGKGYAMSRSLEHHVKYSCSNDGLRRCKKCRVVVSSIVEHLNDSIKCRQHLCRVCGERFPTWAKKYSHMEEVHSLKKKTFPCPECGKVFDANSKLRLHFSIAHTDDCSQCVHCGRKFGSKYKLDLHMPVHTGEKVFVCNVCQKRFNRKSTLHQHMWIHSEVKKHVCKLCDKPFNQKVCWKTHMKTQHPDDYDLSD